MFAFLRKASKVRSRAAEVGWLLDTEKAGFIWNAPQKLVPPDPTNRHAKSVRFCPAVLDHEARLFEITCPIDLHLRFELDPKTKKPVLINAAGDQSTIRSKHLSEMLALVDPKEWRNADRPIVQIITPYVFLADTTCPNWRRSVTIVARHGREFSSEGGYQSTSGLGP